MDACSTSSSAPGPQRSRRLAEELIKGGLKRILDSGFIKFPHQTDLVTADMPMQDVGVLWTDAGKTPVSMVVLDYALAAPNAFGVKAVHVQSICTLVRTDTQEVLLYSNPQHVEGRQRPRTQREYARDVASTPSWSRRCRPTSR